MLGKIQTSLRVRRRRLRRILAVGSITGPFANWSCAGKSVTGLLFAWSFNPPLLSEPADSTWHPCHPPFFFSGGPSLSASFASRRIPFLSASFVSGLFSWGPLPQWHTPLCVCRGLTSVQRESPYTQPLRIAFEKAAALELFTSGCCEPSVSPCFIHSISSQTFSLVYHISSP